MVQLPWNFITKILKLYHRQSDLNRRKKIKYTKILDVAKTGRTYVTIIYDMQARTLFFKTEEDRDEFYGLVQSLVSAGSNSFPSTPTMPATPEEMEKKCPLGLPTPTSRLPEKDREILRGLATKQVLRRGDIVIAEGDIYQRIYTIAEGKINMSSCGRVLVQLGEGEVFGLLTVFHLRPSRLTIEVASDTATLLIIPQWRLQELITTNLAIAVRLHKKATQLMHSQIEKLLASREGMVIGYTQRNVLM